ncbi:uncharacterized protein EV420DRAFT_1653117 [Desarmillaria tabescens]|uniref:Uncharacterized protein n=1 Tax=Armillaria tabescens TaxID=1929756 RepID=A0AA39J3R4_ARMTA|nr:uncharacterized protein EV420DRAFT_1653117 [Desarmillaria tabescens]KAK0435580.1 hypothetical protein EV420DRAFT_1653117 [Desarmillaria tabescens]
MAVYPEPSLDSPHLNKDASRLPQQGWSCDWEKFDFDDFLFPYVYGRMILNVELKAYFDIYGMIEILMYKPDSAQIIFRCGDTYLLKDVEASKIWKFTDWYTSADDFYCITYR